MDISDNFRTSLLNIIITSTRGEVTKLTTSHPFLRSLWKVNFIIKQYNVTLKRNCE